MTLWDCFKKHYPTYIAYNSLFLFLQLLYLLPRHFSFVHGLSIPTSAYLALVFALGIQMSLYLILSALQTVWLWAITPYWQKRHQAQLAIFSLSLVALLSLNCHFFPLSCFSRLFLPEVPASVFDCLLLVSFIILFTLSLWGLYRLVWAYPPVMISLLTLLSLYSLFPASAPPSYHSTTPNLIIIGVDSLSREQLSPKLTPTLWHFLENGVDFKTTISPLARTFPAWVSILTGLYPLHHHARENLYPLKKIKAEASFAWQLHQRGYHTLFASDDRRFNNLGETFGFNRVIGPKIGIKEILLGTYYDLPLSNLFINSVLGQWLTPYNYINRASSFAYYPSMFDKALQKALAFNKPQKPLFLAVHFTLPHWPYTQARSFVGKTNNYTLKEREQLYLDAVHGADQQVAHLFATLTRIGVLENSMIILLSDHGEVLYKSGSRKTAKSFYQGSTKSRFLSYLHRKTATELDKSMGHGSDLLSPAQNLSVLGFQIFQHGRLMTKARHHSSLVSLIDIAPTVADYFHFSLAAKPDGLSLLDTLISGNTPQPHRSILLESGMLPNQALTKKKIVESAALFFSVNLDSLAIEVREDQYPILNAQKLYGILKDNWLLALYPNDQQYVSVILNTLDNHWIDDIQAPFAQLTPVFTLLEELRHFYLVDLAAYPKVLSYPSNV